MAPESSRISDLRRRVHADPASTLDAIVDRLDAEIVVITSEHSDAGAASPIAPAASSDFDAVLASLGLSQASPPPMVEHLLTCSASVDDLSHGLPAVPSNEVAGDTFAVLEQELRAFEQRRGAGSALGATLEARTDTGAGAGAVVDELERWLRALASEASRARAR